MKPPTEWTSDIIFKDIFYRLINIRHEMKLGIMLAVLSKTLSKLLLRQ